MATAASSPSTNGTARKPAEKATKKPRRSKATTEPPPPEPKRVEWIGQAERLALWWAKQIGILENMISDVYTLERFQHKEGHVVHQVFGQCNNLSLARESLTQAIGELHCCCPCVSGEGVESLDSILG